MNTPLRWTRYALLIDVVLIALIWTGLWVGYAAGLDIQSLKWPTASYGGILFLLAGLLSVVVLPLQIMVFLKRRSGVK